tara:strand:+ start:126 stop:872 length:747 start_codon:yes stop_codon:yes gene_type:complete
MANFFQNFPLLGYRFGNEESQTLFQNLTTYVAVIDEIKGNTDFYATGYIRDGERPDTLSFSLYGTTDYYWTFYFLNDDIRESGWPLTEQQILPRAKQDYPNKVFTTQGDISTRFFTGQNITGLTSGSVGKIIKKNIDLGQIIVSTEEDFLDDELVGVDDDTIQTVRLTNITDQYNAVHHYEDTDGVYKDIDPSTFIPGASELIPITNLDRIRLRNEELRTIDVFKPDVAPQISSEFNKLLRSSQNASS